MVAIRDEVETRLQDTDSPIVCMYCGEREAQSGGGLCYHCEEELAELVTEGPSEI